MRKCTREAILATCFTNSCAPPNPRATSSKTSSTLVRALSWASSTAGGVEACPVVGGSAFGAAPAATGGLSIRSTTDMPKVSASFLAVLGRRDSPCSARIIVNSDMPEAFYEATPPDYGFALPQAQDASDLPHILGFSPFHPPTF